MVASRRGAQLHHRTGSLSRSRGELRLAPRDHRGDPGAAYPQHPGGRAVPLAGAGGRPGDDDPLRCVDVYF